MKKTFLTLFAVSLLSASAITSCGSSADKVENAQEDLIDANENLEEAKDDYLKDVELYRIENATKIEANNKSIEEFKSRIDSQKKEAKEDYKAKIADIEAQNTDIKKQMDEYKANGKDHWEAFKINYNRNMENLMRSIMNLK
jgi:ABC-type uncharacterized transport system YnjBCD substrate-binding protein